MVLSLKYCLISLVILLIGLNDVFLPIRNLAHRIFNPVQFGFFKMSLSVKDAGAFYINLKKIRDENLSLREQIMNDESLISKTKELELENRILKDQLDYKESSAKKLIPARIVGVSYENEGVASVLAVGSKEGVVEGDMVVSKNFLLGVVRQVFENRSEVVFITSPNLSIAVLDQTQDNRTRGIVTGNYGTSMIMDRILPEETILEGDRIITSGEDGVFEPGLIIGKVV
ncbi:rod shape-determining protein MreC, partial [candidate division WWE3 bacterium]|nr:rod shape-determining protein MreC [candidate division WWE3 bacterium]